MTIRLYSYAVIERGLTWNQVNEAMRLANASVAGKHFRFYFHKFEEDQGKFNGFSLLAMPMIYFDNLARVADDTDWYISIHDMP